MGQKWAQTDAGQVYFDLYNHAPVGYITVDHKGVILEANATFGAMLGQVKDSLAGHSLCRFILKKDQTLHDLKCKEIFETSEPRSWDLRMLKQDGSLFSACLTANLAKQMGEPICRIVVNDITERKQTEKALEKSEEICRTILQNTGTSIILIEEDMTISMANSQFFLNTGYQSQDIIGKIKWTDLIAPDEFKRMVGQHILRRKNQEKALPNYEFSYKSATGEIRDALINIRLVPGTEKSVASIIDITARRQAEKQLKISEEKFRTLAESCSIAIMMHQGNCWIYANRKAMEMSGYTEQEIHGMHFWDFVHPDYQEMVKQMGSKRQHGEELPESYEFRIITKKGEEKWVSLTGNRIQYEEKPTALISVIDITSRKHNELERARLEGQLQQAQKMESVGRLAGGVAHDFNNMLGVILGHTELAITSLDPEHKIHSNLRGIEKAAKRSADLTRQLLAFARKQTVIPKVLDLNKTVSGMLKMLKRLIGEDIELVWKPGAELWPVKMDSSQVDQILVNLCINARDAISGVGKMTIEVENIAICEDCLATHPGFTMGNFVRISVSDNGCGMDKETLPLIFEPFFTTKEVNQGTGLGLAMVYGAVKQNRGFIFARSEPGQGTTFTIYLPRHVGRALEVCKKEPAEPLLQGQETILVVEDEPGILEVTTIMLGMQGYTVLFADTPGKALGVAGEYAGDIHLLLTDVVMPEMNGRDLACNLLSLYPDIKLLFMSGYTSNVLAHQGVLDEGVYFIQKPFSAKDLTTKIREVLDGEQGPISFCGK